MVAFDAFLGRGGWLGLGFLLFGLVLVARNDDIGPGLALWLRGAETSGEVLDTSRRALNVQGKCMAPCEAFTLSYAFHADRRRIARAGVSLARWVTLKPGQALSVWYLPDTPELSEVSHGGRLLGAGIVLGLGTWLCGAVLKGLRRKA